MTKEEIIEFCKMKAELEPENEDIYEAIIKALEQDSENCVSRKLLSDNICEGISCNECSFKEIDGECGCLLQKRFDELPSVQPTRPTRPTGKWIADVDRWGDIVTTVNGYRCSECNTFNADKDNFCPNCGARMEESEGDECR